MERETEDKDKIENPAAKRASHPMEREGFLKMSSLGIYANLFNCSPGRDPRATARLACHCAEILWDEWVSRGIK